MIAFKRLENARRIAILAGLMDESSHGPTAGIRLNGWELDNTSTSRYQQSAGVAPPKGKWIAEVGPRHFASHNDPEEAARLVEEQVMELANKHVAATLEEREKRVAETRELLVCLREAGKAT